MKHKFKSVYFCVYDINKQMPVHMYNVGTFANSSVCYTLLLFAEGPSLV